MCCSHMTVSSIAALLFVALEDILHCYSASKSGRLKVFPVFVWIITWVSALFFPVQLNFRPAAATPGYVVILFYPGRRETCHEKPCGKSKVHYLIFAARNANVSPVRYRVMEESPGVGQREKYKMRPPCLGVSAANLWMKSWEE